MVVVPVTGRARRGRHTEQLPLFGEHTPPTRPPEVRARIADDDLVEAVGRTAIRPGYVVLGASERVYRREADEIYAVVRVPGYEHDTVHQLVTDGVLKIGHSITVTVTDRGRQYGALLVVMPNHTRPVFDKWCRGRRHHRRTTPS